MTRPIGFFASLFLSAVILVGCGTVFMKATTGLPLDKSKIKRIMPGVTTFSEILAWLGPPDFIIDGTQRMVDEAAPISDLSAPVATRTLASPDGEVILIYSNPSMVGRDTFAVVGVDAYDRHLGARPYEVFIYLSKKELMVTDLGVGDSIR